MVVRVQHKHATHSCRKSLLQYQVPRIQRAGLPPRTTKEMQTIQKIQQPEASNSLSDRTQAAHLKAHRCCGQAHKGATRTSAQRLGSVAALSCFFAPRLCFKFQQFNNAKCFNWLTYFYCNSIDVLWPVALCGYGTTAAAQSITGVHKRVTPVCSFGCFTDRASLVGSKTRYKSQDVYFRSFCSARMLWRPEQTGIAKDNDCARTFFRN